MKKFPKIYQKKVAIVENICYNQSCRKFGRYVQTPY